MGWIMRLLVLTLSLVLVAGCEPDPPPPPDSVDTKPAETGAPLFAYAEEGKLRLMRAGAVVAELDADTGEQAEWAPDGSRFVAIAGEQLVSIDARTGAIAKAACTCHDVAIAAGKVYVSAQYGATELTVFDLATLKPQGPLKLDNGASSIAGAGDRLVTFQISQTGARDASELIIVDPATGKTTNAGKAGQVADTAFTPRGWSGGPLFAYATTGSTGAATAVAEVFWLDPTSPAEQTRTSDRELRQTTPNIAADDWNSSRDHLWWAADGTLRTAAWTWSCTYGGLNGPRCGEKSAHTQWRYDGAQWARTDERDLDSVFDIGAGSSLELGRGEEDKPLTLVEGQNRTALSTHALQVWIPPQRGRPTGDSSQAALAKQWAPLVRLSQFDLAGPADPSDFIVRSTLRWSHDSNCHDHHIARDLDERVLGQGGYHHQSGGKPHYPLNRECPHEGDPLPSNHTEDVGSGEFLGPEGFFLDADNLAIAGIDDPHRSDGVNTAPVYWQHADQDGKPGGRVAVIYWLFYPTNPNANPHEGDWERVAVVFDDKTPVQLTFWAHGHACGLPWNDAEKSDGHPVAYSAVLSHASYPRPGRNKQDIANPGDRWTTWAKLEPVTEQPWWGYTGAWGEGGPKHLRGPSGPSPGRGVGEAFSTDKC